MRTVVVAVNDIGSRQPIAEGDVTTRELAADPDERERVRERRRRRSGG